MEDKSKKTYDLLILGAGPAGMAASVYASRYGLNHLIVGKLTGGLASEAHKVCNFPTETEISGRDLVSKMQEAVFFQGGEIINDEVVDIVKNKELFEVNTVNQSSYCAKNILAATGTDHKKLNIEKENDFLGKGLSYCVTCDGMFYKNKTAVVVGGANSANTASLYLSEIAEKVYQIYRGDKLKGDPTWINKVLNKDNVEVIYNNQIVDIKGDLKLEEVVLKENYKGKNSLKVDGVFVEIGTEPKTEVYQKIGVEVDDSGYIKVNKNQSTNVAGFWAAGDITNGSNNFRQIITACSEGAVAVNDIYMRN